jgi:hypothetical protein
VRTPEPEPPRRREHALLALQRHAGNQAVTKLLRNGKGKGKTATAGLSEDEKKDKVRILTDWVKFTPPEEFVNQWGKPAVKTKEEYLAKLLEKIRNAAHIQESLKSQKNMQKLSEDDDWGDGTYNANTLKTVVQSTWGKPNTDKIGKAWAPFDKHDCVFAAITHVLGYGDKTSDIKLEQALADELRHQYGEVEDSILYRVMEKLGWVFVGRFEKWTDFTDQAGADTFIVSENKDSGGTSGHVIVAEPDQATQVSGNGTKVRLYDRQNLRFGSGRQDPRFAVYAWKVDTTTKLASDIAGKLALVK